MLNELLEVVGFLLVIAFCIIVWWPAALLVAGLGLIAAAIANERGARPVDELELRRQLLELERAKAAS